MAEISVTTPGLLYDPRHQSTAKFWAAFQKQMAGVVKAKPVAKVTAEGRPVEKKMLRYEPPSGGDFPNPNIKGKVLAE